MKKAIKRPADGMKVEMWDIAKVIPYARNARKIPDAAVDKVAASIKEFGFRQPIVVDEKGVIIAGHTRLLAAQKLGLKKVPVHVAEGLTKAQIKAYRLMDNRSHQDTSWDEAMLGVELGELKDLEFDLELTGFEEDDLNRYLAETTEGLTDEDAAPPVQEVSFTEPGDLWILENHRLLCGDSTSIDAVERLMDGQKADMVFTDPPYGVNFGVANHNPRAKQWAKIKNDDKTGTDLSDFLHECFANIVLHSVEAAPVYIWSATMLAGYEMLQALNAAGLHIQSQIIWVKNCIALGQADYQWKHEPCWYGWTPGKNHYWAGGRSLSTVWDHRKDPNQSYEHPAQEPVSLSCQAVENSCPGGGAVLDLFGGSGSTLIGCEKTGRSARLMELDPKYCDVIIRRWQEFTGRTAHLEDGRTLAQLEAKRKKAA